MGIFDFLFGRNNKDAARKPSQHSSKHSASFHDNFIEIPSLGFYGQFERSPSGEWIICWSDSDEQSHRGGYRESGHGRYILYNTFQNKVVLEGKVERPNAGSVADNGSFSIEDWHFGSELLGTFYVFSSSGNELIKKKFQANLYNSAISPNGHFAVCQTANSPKDDGNILSAFDVEKNSILFSIHPITGWADHYTFNENLPQFGVALKQIGTFYYDVNGNLIDPEKFDAARLRCDRYDVVLLTAEELIKRPHLNDELAKNVIDATTLALSLGAEKDESWKALAFKIQGLAYEYLHDNKAALTAFDTALQINPKIGVKRKADALRKKLAQ